MAIYTMNNVRNAYIANAVDATGAAASAYVGTLDMKDGFKLKFTNAIGEPLVTDWIKFNKIRSIKALPYVAPVLRTDVITIAAPIVGQEYIIGVDFSNWGSGSGENKYYKHIGAYKAKTGDTNVTVIDKLVELGNKNFNREAGKYLTFAKTGGVGTETLTVTEVAQPWQLGKAQGRPLEYAFKVVPITNNGADIYDWATFVTTKGNPGRGTGKQVADQEYFYMGERGDKYGMYCQDSLNVRYGAIPSGAYNLLEISFYDDFEHTNVQKAEKQIVVYGLNTGGVISAIANDINALKANTVNLITDVIPGIAFTPAIVADTITYEEVAASSAAVAKTINIKGTGLTTDVVIAVSGAEFASDIYSIPFAAANSENGKDIVLTFTPPATSGDKNGTVIIVAGDTTYTIALEASIAE